MEVACCSFAVDMRTGNDHTVAASWGKGCRVVEPWDSKVVDEVVTVVPLGTRVYCLRTSVRRRIRRQTVNIHIKYSMLSGFDIKNQLEIQSFLFTISYVLCISSIV